MLLLSLGLIVSIESGGNDMRSICTSQNHHHHQHQHKHLVLALPNHQPLEEQNEKQKSERVRLLRLAIIW